MTAKAVPIRDLDDDLVAAISVSGPKFRLNADTIPDLLDRMKVAAGDISQRLGRPKPG